MVQAGGEAGATSRSKATNPLWLLPTALVFVGLYKNAYDLGEAIVRLCHNLVVGMRAEWLGLFAQLPPNIAVHFDDGDLDLLTLWVVGSVTVLILPYVSGERSVVPKSTVSVMSDMGLRPPIVAQIGALLLMTASAALLVAPFTVALQSLQTSAIIAPGSAETRSWLASQGRWLAIAGLISGLILLAYAFFVRAPKLAKLDLTSPEKRDIVVISVVLWLASAALLALALFTPDDGLRVLFVTIKQEDLLVLSLLALAALVAWRSMLPFVQLAIFIVAIFALDGVFALLTRLSGPHG